jgi:hypothetical protein
MTMEGTSVRERVRSLQNNFGADLHAGLAPIPCTTDTSMSKASPGCAIRKASPPADISFAEAGARLSFQKGTKEDNESQSLPKNIGASLPVKRRNRLINSNLLSIPNVSTANTNAVISTPQRTGSSGALEAAALAAQRQQSGLPPAVSGRPALRSPERNLEMNRPFQTHEVQKLLLRSGTTVGADLAAARASVHRPAGQATNVPKCKEARAMQTTSSCPPSTSIPSSLAAEAGFERLKASKDSVDKRGTVATSAAILIPTPRAAETGATMSTSRQDSALAARTVSKKSPAVLPAMSQADRQAKFGVILSTAVSSAPERRDTEPGPIPQAKHAQSFYQLPTTTSSEPIFSKQYSDSRNSETYRLSPLLPPRTRPATVARSSGSSSIADVGAATAMSSRTSSSASLPVLLTNDDTDSSCGNQVPSRRRQVHLKATLRKEKPHHERDKNHNHTGPVSITECERKRYEGVWASNHRRDDSLISVEDWDYIENFVVRKLWNRSKLASDVLGHIW